jgi:50S ribosomal protein L16 3-hydroxylase
VVAIVHTDSFVDNYWRKKPCLLRQLVSPPPVLAIAELLSLTDQDVVESRFIDDSYQLHLGPLHLKALPDNGMVMINGLDQHLDVIDELLQKSFGFLARWRIDDVMASVGGRGSNCGAHFDHYDVFLLQQTGTKTWHLDAGNHADQELRSDTDIRLLENFEATTEINVVPGDVLYVPPGVGHHGVNDTDSITLSIGVRNPTITELVSELADFVIMQDDQGETVDESLQPAEQGIAPKDIAFLRSRVTALLSDQTLMADWYGEYSTRLREPGLLQPIDEVSGGRTVKLQPFTRTTWYESDSEFRLYVNGDVYTPAPDQFEWLKRLCIDRGCPVNTVPPQHMELIKTLARHGALVFSDSQLASVQLK